jgi:ubiquinone/menaquinone biosynthesis C-methylase UbiE
MIAAAMDLAAGQPIHFFVGDAQSIPFVDQCFDVVMARQMLYHVPDIEQAVTETARVLRPGRRFLATTNSANTMPEFRAIRDRAVTHFPDVLHIAMPTERFNLENGAAFLKAHFGQVDVHKLTGKLRFPAAKPFVDYFASQRSLVARRGHSDEEWLALLEFIQAEVDSIIARLGHFDVSKLSGAFVAVKET